MSKIVIRKRVSLEFLGDGYKEAYLVFRSVPIEDLEEMIGKIDETANQKNDVKYFSLILDSLKNYFLEGKFPDSDSKLQSVQKEDLSGLDKDAAITCFEYMTGQVTDPKSKDPLESTSLMEEKTHQTKSPSTSTASTSDSQPKN